MSNTPHQHWEKMVSAAYLRMLGATQQEAAESVGRAERTLQSWEADDRWTLAREEAKDRWLSNLGDLARKRALKLIGETDDLDEVVNVLERLDERLLPAETRVKMEGDFTHRHEVDDARERLLDELDSIAPAREAEAGVGASRHNGRGS